VGTKAERVQWDDDDGKHHTAIACSRACLPQAQANVIARQRRTN
jgi:hypothetical protein